MGRLFSSVRNDLFSVSDGVDPDAFGIANNKWGETADRLAEGDRYDQQIWATEEEGKGVFPVGWDWTLETLAPWVKGAPQLYTGRNPYRPPEEAKGSLLPARIGSIQDFLFEFEYTTVAEGDYNTNVHLWIVEPGAFVSGGGLLFESISAEVMIFLERTTANYGEIVGRREAYGLEWEFRTWTHRNGFPVLGFYLLGEQRFDGYSIHLETFLDALEELTLETGDAAIGRSFLDDYLVTLALMNEVISGTGETEIRNVRTSITLVEETVPEEPPEPVPVEEEAMETLFGVAILPKDLAAKHALTQDEKSQYNYYYVLAADAEAVADKVKDLLARVGGGEEKEIVQVWKVKGTYLVI